MAKAKMVEQLIVTTPNEAGTLARLADGIASAGINIMHLCAYAEGDKANFMIITGDNEKAAAVAKELGYEVSQSQAVEIEFENEPGTLSPIAKKLGDNGVDIGYIFGTSADGKKVLGVMSTNDNDKALALING